jgi:hypothetical protein
MTIYSTLFFPKQAENEQELKEIELISHWPKNKKGRNVLGRNIWGL